MDKRRASYKGFIKYVIHISSGSTPYISHGWKAETSSGTRLMNVHQIKNNWNLVRKA